MNLLDRLKSIIYPEPKKLFFEGQEITPKQKCQWMIKEDSSLTVGPKFGEIVKVEHYHPELRDGQWHIHITGYLGYFEEKWFAPVISDDELEVMMNEVTELMIK